MGAAARPGRKPPYRSLMLEVHLMPAGTTTADRWTFTSHVHLLDENKKQVGIHLPANGLEEIPVAIKRVLRRGGFVIGSDEIRRKP
jgi:hypothetical protein